MIDRIIAKLPEAWRGLAELIAGPIAWVPVLQQMMMTFFFEAQGGWIAAAKNIFLLFPVFLGIVGIPFAMSGMLMRGYLQPGVPWLAFVMLLFWCVLEAAVFTYTLEPRVAMLVADLTGADGARFTMPVLYLLVLTLIVASFACVQALVDAVRTRDSKFLAQILGIEIFSMFFE